MDIDSQLAQRLAAAQQSHLLAFWNELTEDQQRQFQRQLSEIDLELMAKLIALRDASVADQQSDDRAQRAVSPEELVRLPQSMAERQLRRQAAQVGEKLLRAGKVGAILVAGGQGSRLGFDLPKGMFPIGPVSQRSLFQILCEQIKARSLRAGDVPIPYFIMTSEATHAATVEFFEQHNFFDLGADQVFFFQQASLPAIDDTSHRILLEAPGRVATSPDGHGGMLRALQRQGLMDIMRQRGIEHLFYHQVDNPTAIVCDPELLGLHVLRESDLTTKVVAKLTPDEKMGVLVTVDGKTEIIEYSDLTPNDVCRTDEHQQPIFWAGNTAIHVFRRDFLESLLADELSLPFHIAHKKINCITADGTPIEPGSPNGHKFEQFIFDALPHARTALVVEGDRSREFHPVKNARGNDSPETSRAALLQIARDWLSAAGCQVDPAAQVEISPLLALDAEELAQQVTAGAPFLAGEPRVLLRES